jgi:hypothetical protein
MGDEPLSVAKQVTVDKETCDFGNVVKASTDTLTASFTIINNTDDPILILQVVPGCDCTIAAWTKEPIAPSKTGVVTANVYIKDAHPAKYEKGITIYTNSTPQRIACQIKYTIVDQTE